MRPDDVLAPVYREYGSQLWRGVKMSEMLLYWGGDERGNDFDDARDTILPGACRSARRCCMRPAPRMAFKVRGEKRCAVAFIGDGGTSQGAFYEAMNLAGARALPVVFVIVNNKWAISVPIEAQTATRTLAQKAIAAGIPGVQVDGNDIVAVRHIMDEALARARNGDGPTVVEAVTYRLSDHTTADDASRYRREQEVKAAWGTGAAASRARRFSRARRVGRRAGRRTQSDLRRTKSKRPWSNTSQTPKQSTDAMFDFLFANLPQHPAVAQREQARQLCRSSSGH